MSISISRRASRPPPPSRCWRCAAATPAFAQDAGRRRGRGRRPNIVVTATKRETTLLDVPFSINAQTEEDIQRSGAEHDRGSVAQRRRPHHPESRAGPEPGLDPRRLRRPDRPRPAGRQGAGRRLSRRIGDLAVAVHRPTSTCSTSTASRRCAARRAPCSAPARSAARSATSPTSPSSTRFEGSVEANLNVLAGGDFGGHLKGAVNVPLGDTARRCARSAITPNMAASSTPAARAAASTRTSMTAAAPAAASRVLLEPSARTSRSRRASSTRRSAPTASTARRSTTSTPTRSPPPGRADPARRARAVSAAPRELRGRHLARRPHRQRSISARVALTSVTTYINRDILVSRDASALTGSVSVDLGFPRAGACCSRRTWSTPPTSRPSRRNCASSSSGDGPFQWLVGAFYSDVDRVYAPAPADPGLRRLHRRPLRRRHLGRRWPTASRSTRPTMPTCPTTSSR